MVKSHWEVIKSPDSGTSIHFYTSVKLLIWYVLRFWPHPFKDVVSSSNGGEGDTIVIVVSFKGGVTLSGCFPVVVTIQWLVSMSRGVVVMITEAPSSQLTSGRLEQTLLELADFMLTFSRLLVILTVVLRGAGISEAWDSTSWSCARNGVMYERLSRLVLSLLPVMLGCGSVKIQNKCLKVWTKVRSN